LEKLKKNEKLSTEEIKALRVGLANLSLKKYKDPYRRWSARGDNLCHHPPEEDYFWTKTYYKQDKIQRQIDRAIITSIKWKLIGIEHPK
jgi:hypothetical protein